MTFGTHITGDSNLWTPYFIFPEYSILSGFKLLPHFGGRYLATMSSEDAISKTTSPIMAVVEPSERLNEAGDPVSEEVTAANERSNEVDEEAQRASEAANSVSEGERTSQVIEATIPPDESCEQENEVPSHVESIEAGTTPTTPLQITDIGDAHKNGTRTAITEVEKSEITANQLWAPFVLRPAALLLFIGAFIIISICTIIFFIASNRHNGIASVNSNYYYLWTYGPTAGKFTFIQHSIL
jgi:hypothetical protein